MKDTFENEDIPEGEKEGISELQRRRLLLCRKYDVIKSTVSHFTGIKNDVEDLAQDIFLIAYSCIGQLKQIESMDYWLYKIARRYVSRYLKNYRQREKRELSWNGETGCLPINRQSSGDWERMCAKIEYEDLMFFLEKLAVPEQTILRMQYLAGFSLVEIAKMLDMNYNTVKTVKARALRKLREMLEKEEFPAVKRK